MLNIKNMWLTNLRQFGARGPLPQGDGMVTVGIT